MLNRTPSSSPSPVQCGDSSIAYSVVDIAGLQVFVTAKDFGLDGTEGPLEVQNMHDVCSRLDYLRRKVAVDLGFATSIDTAGDESPSPRSRYRLRPCRLATLWHRRAPGGGQL